MDDECKNKREHKKTFFIVAGVNGVGKSTYIKWAGFENFVDVIIDPDKLAIEEGSLIAGCRKALNEIERCIENGISFCQETTLSSKQIIKTIKKAKEHGYYIEMTYLGLDTVEESIARVAKRVENGGHYIPDDVIRRRFSKRFECLARILSFCDNAMLETINDPSADIVAFYYGGRLMNWNLNGRKWASEFIEYYSQHDGIVWE